MLTRERSRHRRVGRTLSGKMLRPRTDLFQEFHDGVDGLFGGEGDEASQERFRRGLRRLSVSCLRSRLPCAHGPHECGTASDD